MRASRELTEVHLPLMELVRMHYGRYPLLRHLIHVPNEGKRSRAGGGILKAMGMVPGVHDLLLLAPNGRGWNGLSLELKAGREKPTGEQSAFARRQGEVGWAVGWTNSPGSAWEFLRWYVSASQDPIPGSINREWPCSG